MKTILYMAISANGFIATDSGNEDFLSHQNWEMFCELARECGNFIVGRKTYEAVQKWNDGYNFDDLVGVEKIIISQNKDLHLAEGYTLASSPQDALRKLSDKRIETALVTGGAKINSEFAKTKLLDEVRLNVEPVLVGRGMPLFAPQNLEIKMKLLSVKQSESGIVTLKYAVLE